MMLFCTQVKYEYDFFPSQWRGGINNANCHIAWSINVSRIMFTSKLFCHQPEACMGLLPWSHAALLK